MIVVDLAPVLERARGELEHLFGPGGHYTNEASGLVARGLLERIAE
jgi:CubicO group peptidase (beta-lactamase class C family)